jgi:DNA transformation protein and related proteins
MQEDERKRMKLRNLGPKTNEWLARIGITSKEEFHKRGAQKVYDQLIDAGYPPNKLLWYGLLGAQEDEDWRVIATRLRLR